MGYSPERRKKTAASMIRASKRRVIPQCRKNRIQVAIAADEMRREVHLQTFSGKKPAAQQILFVEKPICPSGRIIVRKVHIVDAEHENARQARQHFGEKYRDVA